jgi:hypothetical protein
MLASILVFSLLASCGGGGSTSTVSNSNVYISGSVNLGQWPITAGSIQFSLQQMAEVNVTNSTINGAAFSDANVKINGIQLTFNAPSKSFKGAVVPDADGKFVLTVVANGETHTATATAITSQPVMHAPSTFIAAQQNTISWTVAGGVVAGAIPMSYYVEVVDQNNYGPTRLAYSTSSFGLNVTVPANSTTPGTAYFTRASGAYVATLIPTAASASSFWLTVSSDVAYFTAQ